MGKHRKVAKDIAIYIGDCLSVLPRAVARHGEADFVFLDPPQCESDAVRAWTGLALSMTRDTGVAALYGPDDTCEMYLRYMRAWQPNWSRIAWISLAWDRGRREERRWADDKTHCLVYAKEPSRFAWNTPRTSTAPGARGPETSGSVWGFQPDPFFHVPIEPFSGESGFTSAARKQESWGDMATQLPLAFYDRLVRAYTNKGDTVFDLFTGTGGMPLVCKVLGRRAVGIEKCQSTARAAAKRFKAHLRLAHDCCRVPLSEPGQLVQTTFLDD